MVDTARYARDNYETMDPWFQERFKPEHLEVVLTEMELAIKRAAFERISGPSPNVRAFRSDEVALYSQFFNSVLIGIIRPDNFLKYAKEYNECIKTLRRCQSEFKEFNSNLKES